MSSTVTIGMVKNAAEEHYRITGQKLTFLDAVRRSHTFVQPLIDENKTLPFIPEGFLSTKDFWSYIESIPLVDVNKDVHAPTPNFPSEFGNFYLQEENMFTAEDDITAYVHIPYIFDGIHAHDHFEINYVYSGQCVLCIGEKKEVLEEGAFFILAPDSPHNVYTERNGLVISIMIRKTTFHAVFSPLLKLNHPLSDFFRDALFLKDYRGYTVLGYFQSHMIHTYMQSLLVEYYKKDGYQNIAAVSILTLLISQTLREQSTASYRFDFSDSATGNLHITVLLQYIRQNFNSVSLPVLSELFHYSASYLSKLILKSTGRHFSEIVREMKMEHAKQLLLENRLTIEDIACKVGYETANQFSRAFKQYEGSSPLMFRKQKLNRNQEFVINQHP